MAGVEQTAVVEIDEEVVLVQEVRAQERKIYVRVEEVNGELPACES